MANANNGHGHTEHHEHHVIPLGLYFKVIAILLVLTVVTVAASRVNFGPWNTVIAMAIASVKAVFVLAFFMHLKYERRPIVIIALIPFVLAFVLLFALFPDVVNGQYHQNNPVEAKTEK